MGRRINCYYYCNILIIMGKYNFTLLNKLFIGYSTQLLILREEGAKTFLAYVLVKC
nr:MAG TPA: hypothetical protein [Myoviridae sp. ctfuG5]